VNGRIFAARKNLQVGKEVLVTARSTRCTYRNMIIFIDLIHDAAV
jgi:hypothetical protein